MKNGDLTWVDLVPDTLQGWQEHGEQMDRISELREVELEAGSEELLCDCVQRDADAFDGRACPVHARNDNANDALTEAAYYNPDVRVPHKKPVQTQFRFRRKTA